MIWAEISGLVRARSRGNANPRQPASSPIALKKRLVVKLDRDQADQCAGIPVSARRARLHTPRSRIVGSSLGLRCVIPGVGIVQGRKGGRASCSALTSSISPAWQVTAKT
jgi:hypothetical protein